MGMGSVVKEFQRPVGVERRVRQQEMLSQLAEIWR